MSAVRSRIYTKMMENFPCTTKKCLKYPICLSKVNIYCTSLYAYLFEDNEINSMVLTTMKNALPRAESITDSEHTRVRYFL